MDEKASSNTVLIVDDEPDVARLIKRLITQRDDTLNCVIANCEKDGLQLLASTQPAVAIVDLSLNVKIGPESGLRLIERLLEKDPTLRILVLTAHSTSEYGVQALQRGAASFIAKPADGDHLFSLVKDAIATTLLKRNYEKVLHLQEDFGKIPGLIASSQAMQPVIEAIHYSSENNLPLLILGETGVGKGLVARLIHKLSERHANNFVRVQPNFSNCELLSSELFGHEKGAFTGAITERVGLVEESNRGTLFIDEIGELPVETQIMLLETLQERSLRRIGSNKQRSVDFRLISATNLPLEKLAKSGKLRADFFHRIAQTKIEIPPLRDRRDDILLLAKFFAEQLQERDCLTLDGFTVDGEKKLLSYNWPGNVRELQSVIEAACYRANFKKSRKIGGEMIEFIATNHVSSSGSSFRDKVRDYEETIVQEALDKFAGNQTKAAESLGMDRTSFRRILSRLHQ